MSILITLTSALVVVLPLLASWSDRPDVQEPPAQNRPPAVIKSMDGRDLYDFYCVSCHGKSGKGDGPVAPKLKVRPPDLTTLAVQNGGVFPKDRVEGILTGAIVTPTHGSKGMPVWGDVFRFLDPDDQRVRIRIMNLVAYLESLQAK